MKKMIICAVLLFIPFILSANGAAKESKAKSFSIQFMNKTIPLGVPPAKISSILKVEQDSPDFTEKKYSQVYVFKINELEGLRFRFRKNKLVSIGIDSNSTEGPGKEIAAFGQWVEKTYGNGKRVKSKDENVTKTKWAVPGYEIIKDHYFNPESGDSFSGFEVLAR